QRKDVTPEIFDGLLQQATEAVRQKLMSRADPAMKERISRALNAASRHVARTEAPAAPSTAQGPRSAATDNGRLKIQLRNFAKARKSAETVETLALLCGVSAASLRNIVHQGADEIVLILGKAMNLGWPEVQDVLFAVMPAKVESQSQTKALFEKFINLSADDAQRVLRFVKMSKSVSAGDIAKLR
ncbi:MAG: DUF2336 domain-containing protein, partial [Pseudolabrys sp.]|nr:DUF2336 domain-containing protein [Pseudolabrys sp.]